MKTTIPTSRIAPALPAIRRLAIALLRRPVEPMPGLTTASRPAITLAPVTPAANMEGNAATITTEKKQKDDGHNLPYGGQRAAMVKRHGVPRPVRSGFAELASKVRSSRFGPSSVFIPTSEKWPLPPETPPAADWILLRNNFVVWGKGGEIEGVKIRLGVGPFS